MMGGGQPIGLALEQPAVALPARPKVTRPSPSYSVVAPVRDAADELAELCRRVKAVMDQVAEHWELLLVDDGSADPSAEMIALLCAQDDRVRGIRLARPFGFQASASAGLDATRGRAVILMGAGLQTPPEAIPDLIRQWRAGNDVVCAVPDAGARPGWRERVSSGLAHRLARLVTGMDINVQGGGLWLLDRRVVDAIKRMPERHRFLPDLVGWSGFKQVTVAYSSQPSREGCIRHPASRTWLDAILVHTHVPLRLALYAALAALVLSGLAVCAGVLLAVTGAGQAWLVPLAALATILFLGGIQLACVGILGATIGRMYDEMKHRPLYLVDQRWGFGEQTTR